MRAGQDDGVGGIQMSMVIQQVNTPGSADAFKVGA
jgi:hypothetical protein